MEPRETPVKTHTNNRAGWPIRVLSLSIGVREPAAVSIRSQSWRTCLIRVPGAVEVSNVRPPDPFPSTFRSKTHRCGRRVRGTPGVHSAP